MHELGRQKAAVLAVLAAEASPESTEHRDSKADTDVGPKSEKDQSASPCPTARSTRQAWHPSETTPATITYGGESFDVAMTSGQWFFRRVPEAGWTESSAGFSAIIEERLQTTGSGVDDCGNSAADKNDL